MMTVNDAHIPFIKMHGLGNDFVIIDARHGQNPVTAKLAKAVGDRHFGVGFDQLAVIHNDETVDARLVFWNSDGSISGACGNATRCVAKLLFAELGKTELELRTKRGVLKCQKLDNGLVRVNMGQPITTWQDIPLAKECDTISLPLKGQPASCSMGNPHCTYFVKKLDGLDWQAQGCITEVNPLFPERTNVQFVEIIDRNHVRVKVWERGVGVTLASGSSACAVLVNGFRKGLLNKQCKLDMDGGLIEISWQKDGVWMTGPTQVVFRGHLDPAILS